MKECTCGNPKMDFNCTCEWVGKHPGNTLYFCVYCGIYSASKPQCSKCEK